MFVVIVLREMYSLLQAASNGWKIKADPEEENPCYQTAATYCQASTLHGLKYVGDNRLHLIERWEATLDIQTSVYDLKNIEQTRESAIWFEIK